MLYALGVLGYRPQVRFLQTMEHVTLTRLPHLKPQDIANSAWALAKLHYKVIKGSVRGRRAGVAASYTAVQHFLHSTKCEAESWRAGPAVIVYSCVYITLFTRCFICSNVAQT